MQHAGVYRPLRFAKYLPECGWEPVVLTIAPGAIRVRDERLLDGIPPSVRVFRTRTIDPYLRLQDLLMRRRGTDAEGPSGSASGGALLGPARERCPLHVRLARRAKDFMFSALSTPDHMTFWLPFAIAQGARIMRRMSIDAILTTTPPHSSQVIGLALARRFRRPWVVDFRDPWIDNSSWRVLRRTRVRERLETTLESLVVRSADRVLSVSPFYRDLLASRHPEADSRIRVLTNGFDPDDFPTGVSRDATGDFVLSYLGSLYLFQRADPFLSGLRRWLDLRRDREGAPVRVLFAGRGVHSIARRIAELDLGRHVALRDLMPHREATLQMLRSHALLLIVGSVQGSEGILTSKLYEYLASRRPILAIAPEGDAARLVREAGAGRVVTDPSPEEIARGLEDVHRMAMAADFAPDPEVVCRYDGRRLAGDLARGLDEVVASRGPARSP